MKDLVVWVADKNMEAAVRVLFGKRLHSLGIRKVTLDIYVHPQRDPGCFQDGPEIFRGFRREFRHGLLMLDFAWRGGPAGSALDLEEKVREKFQRAGMGDWAGVVVLEPELEAWVWSDLQKSPSALGGKREKPRFVNGSKNKGSGRRGK